MIKSQSSLENKILYFTEQKNLKNKIDNKTKMIDKKNILIRNNVKKEEDDEEKLEASNSQRNNIFPVKKISSKIKENKIRTIFSNEIIKKENESGKSQKNKRKGKIVQLNIFNSNKKKNNFCITDRIFKNNEDNQYMTMTSSPNKFYKHNFKDSLNQAKYNKLKTPKPSVTLFKDYNNNKNKNFHNRNERLKSSDLREFYTQKNSYLYLTTQNNEYDFNKKNSANLNYTIKEIEESPFLNEKEINNTFYHNLKTHRDSSHNNSYFKKINIKNLNNYSSQRESFKNLKHNKTFSLEPNKKDYINYKNLYNSSYKNLLFLRKRNKYKIQNIKLNLYSPISNNKNEQNYNNLNRTFYSSIPKLKNSNISLNSTFYETQHIPFKYNYYSKKASYYADSKKMNKSLAPILENKKYHYLEDTICTKNKMVKKPKNILDDYPTLSKINTLIEKNNINIKDYNKPLEKTKKIINNISTIKKFNAKLKMNNISVKKNYNKNIYNNFNENEIHRNINKLKKNKLKNRATSMDNSISNLSTLNNIPIFNGKIEDYLITKELGKGSYAVVKLAMHKRTREKYAIKIYKKELLLDPQKRNTVKNEINILKQLNHINIMKLYEVIDTSKYLYLVLEYIKGISLLNIIKNEKYHFIEQNRALKLFLQVVKGISYCQSKNINHRDIKLENILVKDDDIVKIIDFGFAVKANKNSYQKLFCGTPSYMPPEIVNKEKYIAQYSDVWSLGVLLFAMLYGNFPFKGKDDEELFDSINKAEVVFPEDIIVSENITDLIIKILNVDPKLRPSPDDIINDIAFIE